MDDGWSLTANRYMGGLTFIDSNVRGNKNPTTLFMNFEGQGGEDVFFYSERVIRYPA
jgi:hypothetical protein